MSIQTWFKERTRGCSESIGHLSSTVYPHTGDNDCDISDVSYDCKVAKQKDSDYCDLNTTVGGRGTVKEAGNVHKHLSVVRHVVKHVTDDKRFNIRYVYRSDLDKNSYQGLISRGSRVLGNNSLFIKPRVQHVNFTEACPTQACSGVQKGKMHVNIPNVEQVHSVSVSNNTLSTVGHEKPFKDNHTLVNSHTADSVQNYVQVSMSPSIDTNADLCKIVGDQQKLVCPQVDSNVSSQCINNTGDDSSAGPHAVGVFLGVPLLTLGWTKIPI